MKDTQPTNNKKRPGLLVRLLALLVTAALLLGAVTLVVYRDRFNLDAVKRWFEFRSLETSDTGEAAPFTHAGGLQASFAYLNSGVLMASATGARYYSFSGELYAEEVLNLENPVLTASSQAGVVYDAGGQELFVFRDGAEAFHLSLEDGGEILSARLNEAGWLVVTSQQSGFKGVVTVYDSSYTREMIQIRLSSTFIMDAALSPDCKTVAVVTMGQSGGAFQSEIRFYPMEKEPSATVSLGNLAVLDLDYESGLLWALGEDQLVLVGEDGAIKGRYSFGQSYLKGCALGGEGFALLLLSRYQAGSASQAVVVGPEGEQLAALDLRSSVLDFAASGRYLSLLTGDALSIYTWDLTRYAGLDSTQNARYTALSPSGAALLASNQQAWLYLPG